MKYDVFEQSSVCVGEKKSYVIATENRYSFLVAL